MAYGKLSVDKLNEFLMSIGNSIIDSNDWSLQRGGEEITGVMFMLDRQLSIQEKQWIDKWSNTKLYYSVCQYAPEIKRQLVFIGDKSLKKKR